MSTAYHLTFRMQLQLHAGSGKGKLHRHAAAWWAVTAACGLLRSVPEDCPQGVVDLVEACLSLEPHARPSAAQVAAMLVQLMKVPRPKRTPPTAALPKPAAAMSSSSGGSGQQGGGGGCTGSPMSPLAHAPLGKQR